MAYETTDQLINLLSHHWYKRPDGNLYKLLDIYNSHLEQISDSGEKVAEWRAIKNAEGTTLDLFGADIEAYRPSSDDDDYRFLIHIMELISHAQGTIPSIYKIMSSALETKSGFKIWKTGIRHIGMQIPFDAVKSLRMQKFISQNVQKMLAMGYWIDLLVFETSTKVQGYLGAGAVDSTRSINLSNATWWKGWTALLDYQGYFGVATDTLNLSVSVTTAKWRN